MPVLRTSATLGCVPPLRGNRACVRPGANRSPANDRVKAELCGARSCLPLSRQGSAQLPKSHMTLCVGTGPRDRQAGSRPSCATSTRWRRRRRIAVERSSARIGWRVIAFAAERSPDNGRERIAANRTRRATVWHRRESPETVRSLTCGGGRRGWCPAMRDEVKAAGLLEHRGEPLVEPTGRRMGLDERVEVGISRSTSRPAPTTCDSPLAGRLTRRTPGADARRATAAR